jgi:hypothetical protein
MIPFQAIRATLFMLLARAREPIGAPELVPAPSTERHRHSKAERSADSHVRLGQMGRRRSDSPIHHTSSLHRLRGALTEWVMVRLTGAHR